MIQDSQTNLLYLADCLPDKYPDFFQRFEKLLFGLGIDFKLLPGTKDVWAVDYMPIQVRKDKFIQFVYNPNYLNDKDPVKNKKLQETISDTGSVCKSSGIETIKSNVKVVGGNVIRSANKVIMTDKVFSENKNIHKNELIVELETLFETDQLIFIPYDLYDFTGHADGMVRFVDEDTVIINRYTKQDYQLERDLKASLKKAGLSFIDIPYNPYKNISDDDANGVYINFLQMKDLIIVPTYKLPEDDLTVRQLDDIFNGYVVKAIESNELAEQGGVLNCISWNIFH